MVKNIAHKFAPLFFLVSLQSQSGTSKYAANLTQTGTTAPVATVYQNDFGAVTFTWGYTGVGVYTCTASQAIFTDGKTRVNVNCVGGVAAHAVTSTTVITVTIITHAGAAANALLTGSYFDIEVWP